MNSVMLREQRAALCTRAQRILDRPFAEGRELRGEESQEFDRIMDRVDEQKIEIDRLERSRTYDRDEWGSEARERKQTRAEYRRWLQTGILGPSLRVDLSGPQPSYRSTMLRPERRDTIITTDAKGGFLATPTQISKDILGIVDGDVFVRQLCAAAGSLIDVVDAKALGQRKVITRLADADWTSEVAPVTEDTTMAFGRRDLTPNVLSKLCKVSMQMLAVRADSEREVNDELAYKFGITQEKAYMTGNGTGKPLGIFVASANGISTARDVTAASSTVVAGDDFVNVKYSMNQGYLRGPGVSWVLSRPLVKAVRKLKVATTTGGNDLEYLWSPGLTEGAPDKVLDLPYAVSEYAPSTFTTGLYVAVLGNFKYYRIAQIKEMIIQRVDQLYAATNEVGFIGRLWVDGAPVMEEGFARLKLA